MAHPCGCSPLMTTQLVDRGSDAKAYAGRPAALRDPMGKQFLPRCPAGEQHEARWMGLDVLGALLDQLLVPFKSEWRAMVGDVGQLKSRSQTIHCLTGRPDDRDRFIRIDPVLQEFESQ